MAPPTKQTAAVGGRRKSSKASLMVTLKLPSKLLQQFEPAPVAEEQIAKIEKEESPSKESSSTISTTLLVATSSNGDAPPESATNTPVAASTPVPSSMPPPTEIVKKRGVKRSGPALGPDGLPKPRGKPGPKKKARLEDGSIDHSASVPRAANGTAAHKLGPKANQGAINAGLRALDRSGKPCRKWQKGSFKLKSFTGVIWEIPRWTAPPRITLQANSESSTSGDSSKENKDNSQMESEKSEKSNNGVDVDMKSNVSNLVSSPAPSLPPPSSATPVTPGPVVEASA
ncbi:INO80 complex, subunit Ies4 [Rhexocercosporidium sp. MPI-PUGE-AT-0058]|nr:INO80 complex, subunit Ies4 [Rhexocercosporidium sp. MPI-PUGE-AT-0058]